MNETDDFDDWPELIQLRDLHHGDRMPSAVRERVLRRAELPRAISSDALASDALLQEGEPRPTDRFDSLAHPLFGDLIAASPSPMNSEPLHWDEPVRASQRRTRRRWLLGASGGLAAAAALALWLGSPSERLLVESEHPAPLELAARPYTAEELRALGIEPGASEVRVVGVLETGSLTRLPPLPPNQRIRCGYHFHLRQPGASGDGIHVEYARCRAPEGLIDDGATCVQVTAVGLLRDDGHLDATRVEPVTVPCSAPR